MGGRKNIKGQKNEDNMPKTQGKGESGQASFTASDHANQSIASESTGTSGESVEVIKAIQELKTDLKKDNRDLKQEIYHLGQEVNGKLDKLTVEMQGLSDRVSEAETRVEQVERWAAEVTRVLGDCLEQHRAQQEKLADLESRSRRNNMRIFGVAEGEEGSSVLNFMEKLLERELPLLRDIELKIQRAHRSLANKPRPEAPPRPIIITFQEFTTKEMVLREAWKKGKIQLGNRTLYFDHDYATEIVKKRKEYAQIKKVLKEKGIRFQTPYTKIRIHWDAGARTYGSAQEAQRELKKRGILVDETETADGETRPEMRLRELLEWQQVAEHRGRRETTAQRAKDKLQEFQRDRAQQV